MTVTQVQMDIRWGDVRTNWDTASRLIDSQPGCDLYILPEMWSSGFQITPGDIPSDGKETLRWMERKARETNAAVCGSLAVTLQDGTCRNRMYFVTPDTVSYYDKRHLFGYGGEDRTYTAGEKRTIVEWRGTRFLLQICYDLRFPCFSRNRLVEMQGTVAAEYDAVIYVASWPESRRHVWNTLLQARAIENQCYVLAVNRVGQDPSCSYDGGTMAIDAYGRVMAEATDGMEGTVTAGLDMDRLHKFRRKFPVLCDADGKTEYFNQNRLREYE